MATRTVDFRLRIGGLLAAAATLFVCLVALSETEEADAAFPGANGPIVFDSNRDVGAGELYTVSPGRPATRLTHSTTSSNPVYSPDGSKIAFVSADPGGSYQVFVINADGTGRRPVSSSSLQSRTRPGLPTAARSPTPPTASTSTGRRISRSGRSTSTAAEPRSSPTTTSPTPIRPGLRWGTRSPSSAWRTSM